MEKLNSFGKKKNVERKGTLYRKVIINLADVCESNSEEYNGAKITPRELMESDLFEPYCTTSDNIADLRKVLHLEDEKLLDGCSYYISISSYHYNDWESMATGIDNVLVVCFDAEHNPKAVIFVLPCEGVRCVPAKDYEDLCDRVIAVSEETSLLPIGIKVPKKERTAIVDSTPEAKETISTIVRLHGVKINPKDIKAVHVYYEQASYYYKVLGKSGETLCIVMNLNGVINIEYTMEGFDGLIQSTKDIITSIIPLMLSNDLEMKVKTYIRDKYDKVDYDEESRNSCFYDSQGKLMASMDVDENGIGRFDI